MKIKLSSTDSKSSVNKKINVNVDLTGNYSLLPVNEINNVWDMYKQYLTERGESNLVRFSCTINPVISNPLFNQVTEVVENEGSINVKLPLYSSAYKNSETVGKDITWFRDTFVRDTQLTNVLEYCFGVNIFNNHLLRSKVFKSVIPELQKVDGTRYKITNNSDFNTLRDKEKRSYHTLFNGDNNLIYSYYYNKPTSKTKSSSVANMYNLTNYSDFYSFEDVISKRLVENEGWFGFYNRAYINNNLGGIKDYNTAKSIKDINRVDLSKNACDFVEMYPSKKHYSFTPLFNEHQIREEKNWNYSITYPFSSTTNDNIIDNTTSGLKCLYFNENGGDLTIYSISKHGLVVDDYVNIYLDGVLFLNNVKVKSVGDGYEHNEEFVFTVSNGGLGISDNWVDFNDCEVQGDFYSTNVTDDNGKLIKFKLSDDLITYESGEKYILVNNKLPIPINPNTGDLYIPNISYKHVINGVESEYYVTLMRNLPNWKFSDISLTEENVTDAQNIKKYGGSGYTFETHNTRLAFAKNIYSDDISQIIFTDNLDLSYLKDNLGRPLTKVYLSIFKNNKGYKEWYLYNNLNLTGGYSVLKSYLGGNTNSVPDDVKSAVSGIEYSHCFGKLSSNYKNFKRANKLGYENVLNATNVSGGLNIAKLNDTVTDRYGNDEIIFGNDTCFYGDLCEFQPTLYDEKVISELCGRFNTAQRELNDDFKSNGTFQKYKVDVIKSGYETSIGLYEDEYQGTGFNEGYYYQMHYPIDIHGFSNEIEMQTPKEFNIINLNKIGTNKYTLITDKINYLNVNDNFFIHDFSTNLNVNCVVTKLNGSDYTSIDFETNEIVPSNWGSKTYYPNIKLEKPDITIPYYARMVNDNTCRYVWREFLKNGIGNNENDIVYPFTNGAFYVDKNINFYLKRQDAYDEIGMNSRTLLKNKLHIDDADGIYLPDNKIDGYIKDNEISCVF